MERADHYIRYAVLLAVILLCSCFSFGSSVRAAKSAPDLAKQYRICRIYQRNLAADVVKSSRFNWKWGADSFVKISKAAGGGELSLYARFRAAEMYHAMSRRFSNALDLGEAIAGFETVARLAPGHDLADDAFYNLALIYYEDKQDISKAGATFNHIVRTYPVGDRARQAARRLAGLKGGASAAAISGQHDDRPLIEAINHWSSGNYSRIVIKATAILRFSDHVERANQRPDRLVVDFSEAAIDRRRVVPFMNGEGLLRRIKSDSSTGNARIEIEADHIEQYRLITLRDPFRLVIDLKGIMKVPDSLLPSLVRTVKRKWKNGNIIAGRPSLARQLGLGIRKIIIDAGHGGKDPGAVGCGGLLEKDVTLAVAQVLAEKLRKNSFEVVLTRSGDHSLALEERTAIANTNKGDIFISIHVNASKSSDKNGVETYILDLTDDEDAMRLAARENATSAASMSDLQDILAGLLNNSKIDESTLVARSVQKSLSAGMQLPDRGVKQAPFYVLSGALMPAILAEIAFLTNPDEAERLRRDKYLDRIAQHLADGLEEYVRQREVAMQ